MEVIIALALIAIALIELIPEQIATVQARAEFSAAFDELLEKSSNIEQKDFQ